ncbi:uncharacterized protein N7496_005260 [Penicillium cataractarum]|uniref:DUF2264 domain-containing protein n=1 Tax=Penicillium cataractarum TaxID=2100454 RepID=A0A9W9SFW2_9EURO|nr:uncharacterized protein N7496_005260 [Penicillium cataractarum]KAJ5377851.1 hypothetical protein N7496_005260 [Penicillium cataractarum]
MPPLRGFSDNKFQDRNDALTATKALIRALVPYFSPGKARVQLPVYSGAHFDETAAQLEGFARPIWAVATAVAESSNIIDPEVTNYVQQLMEGLANGLDPAHPEYWGAIGDWDQRMVEAEPISFALLIGPKLFYEPLSKESRMHLVKWLSGLNGKVMPENNWRWFRIFSNLALSRVCGVPHEDVKDYIETDFSMLDRFDIGNGWSADGIWRKDIREGEERYGRQADYYSGSFAIQFSQLLYCIIAEKSDPDRVARYKYQAREFASQYWRYFDEDGASIPFGRSLTYRFAMGAFYAAFALAKCYDETNRYTSAGFVKGMLFRHLRWWAKNSSHMFAVDGTLTIGYLYPNMFMCEDYNSPQSPYWAMKSLVILSLEEDDEFWTAAEIPHPLSSISIGSEPVSGVEFLPAPSQILCDHPKGQHHFMLSGGQFCVWPLKATQAKYSKFAYSSAFGFSVPTGGLLAQLAPDNTLAISRDDGNTWATRWETVGGPRVLPITFADTKIQCLQCTWKPWKTEETEIETTLIPPCDTWPDWHVRIHRIWNRRKDSSVSEKFTIVEGGFAIQAKEPRLMGELDQNWGGASPHGWTLETSTGSLILSSAGVSGLKSIIDTDTIAEGKVLKSDPNTNLMEPKALIPTIQHNVEIQPGEKAVIATSVFAIANGKKHFTHEEMFQRWCQQPRLGEVLSEI